MNPGTQDTKRMVEEPFIPTTEGMDITEMELDPCLLADKDLGLRKAFGAVDHPLFAVCCQTEVSVEQLNRFLFFYFGNTRDLYEHAAPRLVIVDNLQKAYTEPTTRVYFSYNFPFKGKNFAEIYFMLRNMSRETKSNIDPEYFIVLDEDYLVSKDVVIVEATPLDPITARIRTVKCDSAFCFIEVANLWIGHMTMSEAQNWAEQQGGATRYSTYDWSEYDFLSLHRYKQNGCVGLHVPRRRA